MFSEPTAGDAENKYNNQIRKYDTNFKVLNFAKNSGQHSIQPQIGLWKIRKNRFKNWAVRTQRHFKIECLAECLVEYLVEYLVECSASSVIKLSTIDRQCLKQCFLGESTQSVLNFDTLSFGYIQQLQNRFWQGFLGFRMKMLSRYFVMGNLRIVNTKFSNYVLIF